jgi:PP-loop superfamily ATP-utilizing enzyme
MNKEHAAARPAVSPLEKRSIQILVEKMGLTKKEIRDISNQYGVSAAQLVERMQLSKYRFVYAEETARCAPCTTPLVKMQPMPGGSSVARY